MKKKWLIGVLSGLCIATCAVAFSACGEPPHEHSYTNYVSNGDATYDADGTKTAICDNGCGGTDTIVDVGTKLESRISFKTLAVEGTNVYGKVSNATTRFSFIDEVERKGNATYVVDNDMDCNSPIASKTVELVVGDNTFYVLEEIGNDVKLYTVTIRRREMYTVSFNTAGGTSVSSQTVEEDDFATVPTTTKTGYTFTGWDYDFAQPITGNKTITASWQINQYTLTIVYGNGQADGNILKDYGATIELENPTKEGYTFTGWDNLPATMPAEDRTVTAQWQINQYTLTIVYGNGQADDEITQDYGTVVEVAEPTRAGYDFIGWDKEVPATMPAQDLTITAKWEAIYTLDGGTITGLTDYGKAKSTLNIPAKIDSVSITSIGSSAFEDCDSLTSVTIGDNVTSIGEGAFKNCDSLTEITLPFVGASKDATGYQAVFGYIFGYTTSSSSSNYVSGATYQYYSGSTYYHYYIPVSLKKVTITGGDIGNRAFYNCDMLTSVVIGDSVTSIGNYAFQDCASLTSVTIGDSVTSIGSYAFENCASLTSVVIPDSVTSIGAYAFYDCESLTSISIPDSVTSIGNAAFWNCTSLTEINIPDSVTTIGYSAFSNCDSLTSVTIGDSVTSIGEGAFYNCTSLTSIEVDGNNTAYKSIDGNLYTKDGKTLVQYAIGKTATTFTVLDSVTSIGEDAFLNCDSLTSVVIADNVTSIGNSAFAYCDGLTSVTIGDSVTSIGEDAFYYCTGLTSVTIGDSVTSIGDSAFSSCYSLTSIVIPDSVTSIGDSAFSSCYRLTIYCEAESEPSGWDSNWNNYSNCPVVWGYKDN